MFRSTPYIRDAHGNMTAMPHLAVMEWDAFDRRARNSVATEDRRVTVHACAARRQGLRTKNGAAAGDKPPAAGRRFERIGRNR
jgi:hypothetical protein